MKSALVVWGGWEGHEPEEVAGIIAEGLRDRGFEVEVSDTLDAFRDADKLKQLDLVVPEWTMGEIEKEQLEGVLEAVRSGTGFAGIHGGAGDAFRMSPDWQDLVGGQFVKHPGGDGVTYRVEIADTDHPITRGLEDFEVTSEQYYMHVDPAIHVLATTDAGGVTMPVAWTKSYGQGRVFYCSLGHVAKAVRQGEVHELVMRGMVWAAGA